MQRLYTKVAALKLRTKFLWILFISLFAVFCITFTMARLPYKAYDAQLYHSSVQTISMFADKLDSEMDEIANLSFRILSDNVIQKNLTYMHENTRGTVAWLAAKNEVADRIAFYAHSTNDVFLLELNTGWNISFSYVFGAINISEEEKERTIDAALENRGLACWSALPGTPVRLILTRDVREIYHLTLKSLGVIVVAVNIDQIVERCRKTMEALGCPLSMAIYDGEDCLYYSDEAILSLNNDEDGYMPMELDGRQVLCVRSTSRQGWRFVTVLSYDDILSDIHQASRLALVLSCIAALVAMILGAAIIMSILRHLQVLLRKFDAFAIGTIPSTEETQPYLSRRDEIGQLHRHFDKMARDYDRMMRENYDKQLLLQEAQVRQLRAQIRPHFLYNTLESIYCLAKSSGEERIATMTDALGKMLRATLSDKRDVITVEEDWHIANEYLRIQLLRYEDRLRVECDLEEPALCTPIPSMTLQPLVENAVHHAAEEMLEACVIRVYAAHDGDGVDIIVEDNGPGMDEDILDKLESGELKPDGLGIGLRNIHRRIQLEFAPEYGLRIKRREGKTQVIVHLPRSIQEAKKHG